MSEIKFIFGLLLFLSSFLFIQGLFYTEILDKQSGWNSTYFNSTVIGIEGDIPSPPVCVDRSLGIFSDLACGVDYIGWLVGIMFFKTNIWWFNALILIPIFGVLALLIVNIIRGR